jgi:lambda repressor-like predicted transcriptional regulator
MSANGNGNSKANGKSTGRPRSLTRAQVIEAAGLEARGWSLAEIAARYGCTPPTIRKAFARLGAGESV